MPTVPEHREGKVPNYSIKPEHTDKDSTQKRKITFKTFIYEYRCKCHEFMATNGITQHYVKKHTPQASWAIFQKHS